MNDLYWITNADIDKIKPGTKVRGGHGVVIYEVLDVEVRLNWLMGRLRDTRTGRSVGWKYLDTFVVIPEGYEVPEPTA